MKNNFDVTEAERNYWSVLQQMSEIKDDCILDPKEFVKWVKNPLPVKRDF